MWQNQSSDLSPIESKSTDIKQARAEVGSREALDREVSGDVMCFGGKSWSRCF